MGSKINLFAHSPYYRIISPTSALRFIWSLGENCKNPDFWANFFVTNEEPRVESAQKGKKGEVLHLGYADYMAIACRLILSKGVSGDSVNPCESVLESFETNDVCLLAFAISL